MTVLESRLSKLEATAGIGLSQQEQFNRLAESQSDEVLLQVLYWLRAQIKGATPPEIPDDIVALAQRLCSLMPDAG